MELFIEQAGANDAELRRSRTIIGHILAPALASCEPSNSLSISLTSAQTGAEQGSATVRIGDVSLVVPRPVQTLSHCVPALYLSGKGQVSIFVSNQHTAMLSFRSSKTLKATST